MGDTTSLNARPKVVVEEVGITRKVITRGSLRPTCTSGMVITEVVEVARL